jgi:hypothetical protein
MHNLDSFFIEMITKEAEELPDSFEGDGKGMILITISPSYFPFETLNEYKHFEKMVERELRAYFGMSSYLILDSAAPRDSLHISVNRVTDSTVIEFVKLEARKIVHDVRKAQMAVIESIRVSGDTL